METINRNSVNSHFTENASETREILAPRNSSVQYQSLAEIRVAPGKTTEEHFHIQTEEIYYVLRGKGRMWVENEFKDVKAGDGIAIPSGKRHKIQNIGKRNLIFLCCSAPACTSEDTVFILK